MSGAEMAGNVFGGGFDVVEEVAIDGLGEVKAIKTLIPPTKDVKFLIKSASPSVSKDNNYRQIKLQLQIVDGILIGDKVQYKGSVLFQNVCYFAEPTKYTSKFFMDRQHLIQLQFLLRAIGTDLAGLKVNDELFRSLTGKYVLATIKQSNITIKDENGNKVKTADMQNEVVNYKASEGF